MPLDVYRDWLEITETARPLNYYQVLKLNRFEDDSAKIRATYRKLNSHVRKYGTGEFAQQSQDLLNELAKAMLCLTDEVRKREYDASLGRNDTGDSRRRTMEEILVGRKVLDSAQLDKARRFAKTINVELRDAVMQQKLAAPELVMQAYAESAGLPYIDLNDVQLDPELIPKFPAVLARQNSCAPLMVDDGRLLVVSPHALVPEVEDQLRLRTGFPVRTVLCTPAGIHEIISKHYPREAAAAEMAGAPPKSAPPRTASSKTTENKEAPSKAIQTGAEERHRRRIMICVMAFNFSFFAWYIVASVMRFGLAMTYLPGFLLASLLAGLAWMLKP